MNKKRLYWILQIVGWTLYGLLNIYITYLSNNLSRNQAVGQLLFIPIYISLTHIYRNVIMKGQWLQVVIQRLIPRVILACLILSTVDHICLLSISSLLGNINPKVDLSSVVIFISILANLILYFLWSLGYFMYHYVENYNRSLKFNAVMNEVELNNLKSQLNPHFIFNALNSVRALVDEDPAKSKRAITQLSNILRNSLIVDRKRLISFNDELNTVIDFLALEKIRYEERLVTQFDIIPESSKFQIPPLMMQTLVENGIKHGIAKLTKGGVISIETKIVDANLLINIRNTGRYSPSKRRNEKGFGIENTKQRLKLIFERKASFSIKNEEDGQVLTAILIPSLNKEIGEQN
jgi:two-component system LytT family sensor kinase